MRWLNKIFGPGKGSNSPESSRGAIRKDDWRRAMQEERINEAEFYRLCTLALQELMAGATIVPGETTDSVRITKADGQSSTVSFYNIYRNTIPEGRVEQVERFAKAFGGTIELQGSALKQAIVPLVKDVGYLANFKTSDGAKMPVVTEHIAADLWIVYAVDLPDSMRTLRNEELVSAGVKTSDLRKIAVENLRRILPPLMRHGDGPVFMLTAGSDYVASLLLFDDVWEELQDLVEGDIVAAVPSRDVVLFTSSTSKEGLETMRESVTRIMGEGGYLVSSSMFRRTGDGWKPFS